MDSSDLAFAGAATQARMLADGEVTALELLEIYLQRIARLDSELRDAGERLPLLGVPIAIKDDVDVAGEVTTCGSGGHDPNVTSDTEVVRRVRAAARSSSAKPLFPI